MKKEITKTQINGWTVLFANIIFLLAAIAIFIYGIVLLKQRDGSGGFILSLGIIMFLTSIILFAGLFTVEPNEAVVLILFGKYIGTEKTGTKEILEKQKLIKKGNFFNHVRFEEPVTIKMDGRKRIYLIQT